MKREEERQVIAFRHPFWEFTKTDPKLFQPERIFFCISNQDQEELEEIPHQLEGDLVMTYHVLIERDRMEMISGQIDHSMLKEYGITQEELHKIAMENTPKLFPANFLVMEHPNVDMHILTNTDLVNGASVLFYPGMQEQMREQMGGDFYVLPSSIHETILVPVDEADPKELQQLVQYVNETEVEPEDLLSNSVYKIDEHGFTTVVGKEQTQQRFQEPTLNFVQTLEQEMDMEEELEP